MKIYGYTPLEDQADQVEPGLKIHGYEPLPEGEEPGYLDVLGKSIRRGTHGMAGNVGSVWEWIGDVLGSDYLSEGGKNLQKEAAANVARPDLRRDPVVFGGEFEDNPSLKRGVGVVGETVPSLGAGMGATLMTGNPLAGAGLLGLIEGAGQYSEARRAGKSVGESSLYGGLSTIGTTLLEFLPLGRLLKLGGKGKVVQAGVQGLIEGGTETGQTAWQNIIAKVGYDHARDLSSGMVESFIGGAGSGAGSGLVSAQFNDLVAKAQARGVTDEELAAARTELENQVKEAAKEQPQAQAEPEIKEGPQAGPTAQPGQVPSIVAAANDQAKKDVLKLEIKKLQEERKNREQIQAGERSFDEWAAAEHLTEEQKTRMLAEIERRTGTRPEPAEKRGPESPPTAISPPSEGVVQGVTEGVRPGAAAIPGTEYLENLPPELGGRLGVKTYGPGEERPEPRERLDGYARELHDKLKSKIREEAAEGQVRGPDDFRHLTNTQLKQLLRGWEVKGIWKMKRDELLDKAVRFWNENEGRIPAKAEEGAQGVESPGQAPEPVEVPEASPQAVQEGLTRPVTARPTSSMGTVFETLDDVWGAPVRDWVRRLPGHENIVRTIEQAERGIEVDKRVLRESKKKYDEAAQAHREIVEKSVAAGVKVPAEVLADYPDLKPQVAETDKPQDVEPLRAREPQELEKPIAAAEGQTQDVDAIGAGEPQDDENPIAAAEGQSQDVGVERPGGIPDVGSDGKPYEFAGRVDKLMRYFGERLDAGLADGGLPTSPTLLRTLAKKVAGGDPREYTDDIYDAIEGAVNKKWREDIAPNIKGAVERIDRAADVESAVFGRRTRTLSMMEKQQFSTPLPISEAVVYAADIHFKETVLEPTAGTGNLLAPVPIGTGTKTRAMELDPRRVTVLQLLGHETAQGDYLKDLNIPKADVIVTNPPWGSLATGKYHIPRALKGMFGDIGERFVMKNMKDLNEGGRLVALLQGGTLDSAKSGRFRKWLEENHTVRAWIKSPPGSYKTRGASDKVRSVLLVVDKGKVPGAGVPIVASPENWYDYGQVVKPLADGGSHARSGPATREETPASRPVEEPAKAAPRPVEPARGERGEAGDLGQPGVGSSGQAVPESAGRSVSGGDPGRPDTVLVSERGPGERPQAEPQGTDGVVSGPDEGHVEPGPGKRPETGKYPQDVLADINDSPVFARYVARAPRRGAPAHPRPVVETRALAGVSAPELTYKPSKKIEEALLKRKVISQPQYDAIVAAGQANNQPRHQRHGILIADDVGTGKSRVAAGIALDMLDGDRNRVLVVSKGQNNLDDLVLADGSEFDVVAGGKFPYKIINVKDHKEAQNGREPLSLPKVDKAVYVLDYYNIDRYDQALASVGLDAIIGDEAHQYENVHGSKKGQAWRSLHYRLGPDAHYAYLTATPAASVQDLEYLYGLREWTTDGFQDWLDRVTGKSDYKPKKGEEYKESGSEFGGDAGDSTRSDPKKNKFRRASDIVDRISPAEQEQIMRELKMKGKYISRDLWRGGVEFEIIKHPFTEKAKADYDEFIQLARDINRLFEQNRPPGNKIANVRSLLQFEAKRRLAAWRLQGALEEARASLARSEQPVISVITVSGDKVEGGNLAAAINMINTHDYEVDDDTGAISDNGEIPEVLFEVAELWERLRDLYDTQDPLEMMEATFGAKNVALITGKVAPGKRRKLMKDFQSGVRKVALISKAGKTGINLHQVLKEGRRNLIVTDYEWSSLSFKQELGRVDRSGQVGPPIIKVISTENAAEKKFLATIANRMKGLGAVSKGQAESTGTEALEEFELGGGNDLEAMRDTFEDLEAWEKEQFISKCFWNNQANPPVPIGRPTGADLRQFTLDLQTMPVDMANRIYEKFMAKRAEYSEAGSEQDERKAQRQRGEILRETDLADNLKLVEVKTEEGKKHGIVTGEIIPRMDILREYLPEAGGKRYRYYMTFRAGDRSVSGLVIQRTFVDRVKSAFGAMAGPRNIAPHAILEDLAAGDRIELENGWALRQRKDGRISIDKMRMADYRGKADNHGARFVPVGSWYMLPKDHETINKFLKRYPVAGETVYDDSSIEELGVGVNPFKEAGKEIRRLEEKHPAFKRFTDYVVDQFHGPPVPNEGGSRQGKTFDSYVGFKKAMKGQEKLLHNELAVIQKQFVRDIPEKFDREALTIYSQYKNNMDAARRYAEKIHKATGNKIWIELVDRAAEIATDPDLEMYRAYDAYFHNVEKRLGLEAEEAKMLSLMRYGPVEYVHQWWDSIKPEPKDSTIRYHNKGGTGPKAAARKTRYYREGYLEGVLDGLTPANLDRGVLHLKYVSELGHDLRITQLLNDLWHMRITDPDYQGLRIWGFENDPDYQGRDFMTLDLEGFKRTKMVGLMKNPLFDKVKADGTVVEGWRRMSPKDVKEERTAQGLMLMPMKIRVYAPIARDLKAMLGTNPADEYQLYRFTKKTNSMMKRAKLSFSGFHFMAFFRNNIQMAGPTRMLLNFKAFNPFGGYSKTGLKILEDTFSGNPHMIRATVKGGEADASSILKEALSRGILTLHEGKLRDYMYRDIKEGVRTVAEEAKANKVVKKIKALTLDKIDEALWDKAFIGAKVTTLVIEAEKNRIRHPDWTWAKQLDHAARDVNNLYGGLELDLIANGRARSKMAQDALRMLMLAPDWTESNWRYFMDGADAIYRGVKQMAGMKPPRAWKEGPAAGLVRTVLWWGLITQILNYALNGAFTWDEHDKANKLYVKIKKGSGLGQALGFKEDYYLDVMGHLVEPAKVALRGEYLREGIERHAKYKMSQILGTMIELAGGGDWAGRYAPTWEQILNGQLHGSSYKRPEGTLGDIPGRLLNTARRFAPIPLDTAIDAMTGDTTLPESVGALAGLHLTPDYSKRGRKRRREESAYQAWKRRNRKKKSTVRRAP